MGTKLVLETVEVLDEGVYDAVVQDVTEEVGEWGSYYLLSFDVGEGRTKKGATSDKFSTRSKLYKWVRNILGHKLEPGFVLDTDDLIGKPCQLVIEHDVDSDGNTFDRIANVIPAPKQRTESVPEPDGPPDMPF